MSGEVSSVTVLFTDLVNSAELLQQIDDERAQRILRAHHRLLKNAGAPHGALEVRWLGDGLMSMFVSTADAVRCAIAMQQAARRRVAGERLSVRVGLNVAAALREETDYFGTPVAIARRLCERAQGGQILCSGLVAGLLAGQQAFSFRDCGALALQGLATPVAASEVLYRHDEPAALLAHTPFVGRAAELAKLTHHLQEARAGHGGLVLLAGEPGIGKTRLTEEFTESAAEIGALVLAGRCYEGESAPPYGPFAEAIAAYTRNAEPEQLRQDLGLGAPPIARLVAAIRERVPDIPEAVALQPDEERFRLLDAVSQFLLATAARTPVVLIVDDLHWADKGSIAMLRHVARFAPRNRLLILVPIPTLVALVSLVVKYPWANGRFPVNTTRSLLVPLLDVICTRRTHIVRRLFTPMSPEIRCARTTRDTVTRVCGALASLAQVKACSRAPTRAQPGARSTQGCPMVRLSSPWPLIPTRPRSSTLRVWA